MTSPSQRIERDAVFSDDMRFRYRLTRRWGPGRVMPVICCNPSKAGAELDDPSVRRLIGFARRLGYDAIDLGNCFAYIATFPDDLRAAGYPIGPDNDTHLENICRGHPQVVCGWGSITRGLVRPQVVLALLKAWGCKPMALQINAGGIPAHPSRLAYSRALLEF